MEIYKPPYLFTSSGALAPRPTITSAPAVVGYGQTFSISTPNAASISKVMLMRPGSNTHAFDFEQRLIYTYFTKGSGTLSVTAPTTQGAAPPGYYMLFLLDTNGVPSVAKFVQLMPNPTNQPPTATITAPASSVTISAGQSVTFASTASAPDGSVALYSWNFPGGSPKTSNVQNPGAVTFATPGVYSVSLTVLDNLGVNNPSPPTVTVTVTGTATLGAAITSPANGATVSGTVTVNMTASNIQGTPTQFVLKLDNTTTLYNQSVTGSTASSTWNTTTIPDGTHTLTFTATDAGGKTATASVGVTVSNGGGGGGAAPTVSITSPTSGVWTGGSIEVKATATDSVALTSLKLWGNGAVFGTVPCSATSCAADIWWVTGSLAAAAYQVQATATDSAGKCTVSGAVTINKDATSPVVPSGATCGGGTPGLSASITSPANGATVSGASSGVSMSVSNAQTPTQFVLKLDGSTTLYNQSVSGGTASTTWNTTTVPDGAHTLTFTATDAGGKTATASISVNVANGGGGGGDTTPPTVAITKPGNGAWTGGSIDIIASGSDNVGLTSIAIFGDGALVQTIGCSGAASCNTGTVWWVTSSLASGQHTITAVATDTSGNKATSAPVLINK